MRMDGWMERLLDTHPHTNSLSLARSLSLSLSLSLSSLSLSHTHNHSPTNSRTHPTHYCEQALEVAKAGKVLESLRTEHGWLLATHTRLLRAVVLYHSGGPEEALELAHKVFVFGGKLFAVP